MKVTAKSTLRKVKRMTGTLHTDGAILNEKFDAIGSIYEASIDSLEKMGFRSFLWFDNLQVCISSFDTRKTRKFGFDYDDSDGVSVYTDNAGYSLTIADMRRTFSALFLDEIASVKFKHLIESFLLNNIPQSMKHVLYDFDAQLFVLRVTVDCSSPKDLWEHGTNYSVELTSNADDALSYYFNDAVYFAKYLQSLNNNQVYPMSYQLAIDCYSKNDY